MVNLKVFFDGAYLLSVKVEKRHTAALTKYLYYYNMYFLACQFCFSDIQ